MNQDFPIETAVLGMQRALLDVVTPELRAVVVNASKRQHLYHYHFYHEGEITEEALDLWQCAQTEASCDFSAGWEGEETIERLDFPARIPFKGRYAYLRREATMCPKATGFVKREVVPLEESRFFISACEKKNYETRWGILHHATDKSFIIPAKPKESIIGDYPLGYATRCLQRALLGAVSPELRCASVQAIKGNPVVSARIYHDGPPSPYALDFWECALSELAADFGPGYQFDFAIERLDYPKKISSLDEKFPDGRYVYARKEDRPDW